MTLILRWWDAFVNSLAMSELSLVRIILIIKADDDFFKDISSNKTNNRNSNESSGNGLVRVNEINHNQIDIVCIDENKKWFKNF